MPTSDFKLDALLRAVTVPSGLLERLLTLPYADDAGLDESVRDVELPDGLLPRLAAIPLADDAGLDEALRNVPLPRELETSFHRHAHRMRARRKLRPIDRVLRISRIAMAASLVVAVSLSLGSAFVLSWLINRASEKGARLPVAEAKRPEPAAKDSPLEASWRMLAEDEVGSTGFSRNAVFPPGHPLVGRGTASAREIELAQLDSAADRARREEIASGIMPAGADPLALGQGPELGIHDSWDNLPELPWRPTSLSPHGLDWPLVPGSNRQFLIDKKFHPFVMPLPGTALQSCAVPLAVEPSSYELTRRYLERNELPPPDRVRTEDFLAALDYGFPRPPYRGLGLTVAGGDSPISGAGFSLLQIGVQAWQGDAARHAPLHLVLLVDTSTSMRWGSRLEIVRRALAGLPELLGPEDRVSLVTFNQAAHVLVENLDRGAMSQFRAAAGSLAAEGSTNFLDGLREASGVAHNSLGPNRPAVRMVLLTDGLLDLDPDIAAKVEKDLSEAAQQGIHLDAIDLGQQQKDADPQLVAMSQAGQGGVHRAVSAEQVRWALREIVTGRSQLVARAARLRVTFNPKAVLEYRIVGHEAGEWAGMLPGAVEADFREGQAATGLFELRLAPSGPGEVAVVELTWYATDGDNTLGGKTMQRVVAVVRRGLFAESANVPTWFQQAGVAAYTAEVLRHSPFIFQRNPGVKVTVPAALRRAQELSLAVDRQAAQAPSYQELVELIRQEMKARPATRRER